MTAEQLEELMGKVTQGEWDCHYARPDVKCDCRYVVGEHGGMGAICTIEVDNGLRISEGGNDAPCETQARANATIITLAPSLARRVIAAERLVEALCTVRDYVSDAKDGALFYDNGDRLSYTMASEDLDRIDTALTAYREARK